MKHPLSYLKVVLLAISSVVYAAEPARHWSLDSVESPQLLLRGKAKPAPGIDEGRSLAFDGVSVLEVPHSTSLTHNDAGFSLTAWVNPYAIGRDQMIAAKNRYSTGDRE